MAHQYHHPLHAVFYCCFSHGQGIEGVKKNKTSTQTAPSLSNASSEVLSTLAMLLKEHEDRAKQEDVYGRYKNGLLLCMFRDFVLHNI